MDPDAWRDPREVNLANALNGNLFAGGQEDIHLMICLRLVGQPSRTSGSPRGPPGLFSLISSCQLSPYEVSECSEFSLPLSYILSLLSLFYICVNHSLPSRIGRPPPGYSSTSQIICGYVV